MKFADDTGLLCLISKDDDTEYLSQIEDFVDYSKRNFLELNVSKTKEMVIDFRKSEKVQNVHNGGSYRW